MVRCGPIRLDMIAAVRFVRLLRPGTCPLCRCSLLHIYRLLSILAEIDRDRFRAVAASATAAVDAATGGRTLHAAH